ncbi:CcdC family protein [Aquibacillus salsiterrae]|uniref:Cytochrome c biogenesis protein CcdC n=1 Tax=Aquibacillus salsiterrae TaxID=2950439 RepID=A0A9X4AE48_9BACI|nr:cytochrome c biogenesis protein CcdC [Aquibacillus salsiterrae]MDC3416291.1 cytochrome c biogenesis protein CcdC [Aquibacillus salsiterrae]
MFWAIASSFVGVIMAISMIIIRLKAAKKPVSIRKIILPPLFMSTGALMFIFPEFRVPWAQVFEATIVGAIFSILLVKTTKFEVRHGQIYLIPSKIFAVILFGLLLVRVILKLIIGQTISLGETSGMFFLLAFAMIISWRLAMLVKYRKVEQQISNLKES